jgi:hypothetical protein
MNEYQKIKKGMKILVKCGMMTRKDMKQMLKSYERRHKK